MGQLISVPLDREETKDASVIKLIEGGRRLGIGKGTGKRERMLGDGV